MIDKKGYLLIGLSKGKRSKVISMMLYIIEEQKHF